MIEYHMQYRKKHILEKINCMPTTDFQIQQNIVNTFLHGSFTGALRQFDDYWYDEG